MESKAAYKEILKVLNKHSDLLKNDHKINIIGHIENRIAIQDVSEEFSITIKPESNVDWCELNQYIHIGLFGEDHRRTIGCSDDGNQPQNERLLLISFPTGAYIFGEAYCTETFGAFFNELQSYAPKFSDRMNKSLYFSSKNAHAVYSDFDDILKKHRATVKEELRKMKVKELEKELSKLKGE